MERREDRPRPDGVHPYPLPPNGPRRAPASGRDRGLDGIVLQVAATRDDGSDGGGVNNDAAPDAAHQRNRRLGTGDLAHQFDVEDLVPVRLVDLLVFTDAGVVDQTAISANLNRNRSQNKHRQAKDRCQIPASKSVQPCQQPPSATPARPVRARTHGTIDSRIPRQHSGVSRAPIRIYRSSPRPAADCPARATRPRTQRSAPARRSRSGADRLPDVATVPVVSDGSRRYRDWLETVELVAAAFRPGLGPGKEPALAPSLPFDLSSGDGHDSATPIRG
jgi:hypothetical protein